MTTQSRALRGDRIGSPSDPWSGAGVGLGAPEWQELVGGVPASGSAGASPTPPSSPNSKPAPTRWKSPPAAPPPPGVQTNIYKAHLARSP